MTPDHGASTDDQGGAAMVRLSRAGLLGRSSAALGAFVGCAGRGAPCCMGALARRQGPGSGRGRCSNHRESGQERVSSFPRIAMSNGDPRSQFCLRLLDFDLDGALHETSARLPADTRAGFLRRTAGAGAAVLGALAVRPAVATQMRPPAICGSSTSRLRSNTSKRRSIQRLNASGPFTVRWPTRRMWSQTSPHFTG